MKTVQAEIPDAVLKRAEELAKRENISLRELVSLALTQAIAGWTNESYIALRRKGADRERFLGALKEVPDVPAPEFDKLPQGFDNKF